MLVDGQFCYFYSFILFQQVFLLLLLIYNIYPWALLKSEGSIESQKAQSLQVV